MAKKVSKKFKWGEHKKCGIIGCNQQINWSEFTSYLACENHRNRKWGQCEACRTQPTTHTVYYDIYHGEDNAQREVKEVSEGIRFQKEIIEKLRGKNISNSLREKLNEDYQKAYEVEKIIPELEKLTSEYWEKKLNCASDLIKEKGGQQTNAFESNLCDSCGDEVDERQQKLKNTYQSKVLNKLILFSPETTAQIEKEIGREEAMEVAYHFAFDKAKMLSHDEFIARWYFTKKIPFFKSESEKVKGNSRKKAFFQKLRQYFESNQIRQIVERGGFEYIVWYENGDIEEKSSSQLPEWSKLRAYFFNTSTKGLSLHEINIVLKKLDQVPNLSKEEEEELLDRNKKPEKGGVLKADSSSEQKNLSLSKWKREAIKSFFQQNNIQKVEIDPKNGTLIITHNNNNEVKEQAQIKKDPQLELIQNLLQKSNQKSLTRSDLDRQDNSQNSPTSKPNKSNYVPYLVGGSVGVLIILVGLISYYLGKKKNKKA